METNWKFLYGLIGVVILLIALMGVILSCGCVTSGKNVYHIIVDTPEPTATPVPIPTKIITTVPTPTPVITIPTAAQKFVDPFAPGERSEGQWYKWLRNDVLGLKDLNVGIILYRHRWMDRYTWYNPAMAQYYTQAPSPGNRYFVVWVHEEMFGENQSFDPRMWGFDETAFRLQAGQNLYAIETSHNPVARIKEFDDYVDYTKTVTAGPFGYDIIYTGQSLHTGGFVAQRQGWLRMGAGNAFDGYMIFEIPKETQEKDIRLLGNFASFGDANWKIAAM
jgi:hypothetical protein